MMMQMIAAAGIPPFVDDHRPADESNPRGYLEHAAVRRLERQPGGLEAAVGHVVKVVSPLLGFLPLRSDGEGYRVVFVRRATPELLASQAKMLAAKGEGETPADAPGLGEALEHADERARRLAEERADMATLVLEHRDVLAEPRSAARRVAAFVLGGSPEAAVLERMAAVVDPALYRSRSA